MTKNENPIQGSFVIDELTELDEEAELQEFERISERGGVRGAMTPRRLDLVRLAFTKVDKDDSGILDAQDIVGCYELYACSVKF